ncbi:MAG TPA: alkyl sulfatase dimerization domain-containing protein [Kofleriaceae bacterium]|nr:alkyl sulfatase dimerization domain-containing protein [Kofleriaceae bacterium]
MGVVLDIAERAWQGQLDGTMVQPGAAWGGLERVADGVSFILAFANISVVETGDGLLLVDATGPFHAGQAIAELRRATPAPVRAVVVTHGHVDHVFGLGALDEDARRAGAPPPEVVAHRAVAARFERYRLTAGWNGRVNQRQFALPAPVFPTSFRAPDRLVDGDDLVELGGVRAELRHDRGETDDALWVWLPASRTICAGDFVIWAAPNCGNPQKVQRYPREWAAALRRMAALDAEVLLPGHGPPVLGAARVRTLLDDTAAFLEELVEKTLALMNAGATLDEIVHAVHVDDRWLTRPYLRPVYDDPEFIVRNVHRLYGGWWDGNPAHLKPPPHAVLARALSDLAGGASALTRRAEAAAADGDLRLAAELVELAFAAAPDDPSVRGARAAIYQRRVAEESSLMARAIFAAAARESR